MWHNGDSTTHCKYSPSGKRKAAHQDRDNGIESLVTCFGVNETDLVNKCKNRMKINSVFYATVLAFNSYDATDQKHTTRTPPSSTHTFEMPPTVWKGDNAEACFLSFHHFRFRHDQFPPVPCYLFVASRLSQYSPFRQTFFRSLPADRRMVLTVSISQQKPAVGMFRAVAFHRICSVSNDVHVYLSTCVTIVYSLQIIRSFCSSFSCLVTNFNVLKNVTLLMHGWVIWVFP